MTTPRYLLVLLAACGQPMSTDNGVASTSIFSPMCTQLAPDAIEVHVEGLTTLASGNAFDATITAIGAPTTASITEFYSCGSWSETFDGMGASTGCTRASDQPIGMQAINVTHDEQLTGGSFPVPTMISITIDVRSAPGSTMVLDTDSTTIVCQ